MLPAQQSRFGQDTQGEYLIFDLATVGLWLHFQLHNVYVKFGGELFLQAIGAPMGANNACNLADWFLAKYELRFMRNLARIMLTRPASSQVVVAKSVGRAFSLTRRYIDDLGANNNPYLKHLLYRDVVFHGEIHGIYPRSLNLKQVHEGTWIDYMDMEICPGFQRHKLTTILYDKREHPPLSPLFIVSLPHASSQIALQAKYGVVTSQLHRYYRIIMFREDFIFRAAALLAILYGKGYDIPRMLDMLCRFCKGQQVGYGLSHQQVVRKVEARLLCMLDGMTDAYYVKLYADEERRARVIAMDVLFRLA